MISPDSNFLESSFTTFRWITRFIGRAPKSGSNPILAIVSIAWSLTSKVISLDSIFSITRSSWILTMDSIASEDNGLKVMISSIRLINSGLRCFLSAEMISFSMDSIWDGEFASASIHKWLPRLLVIIITVFLKSTIRPWPSVNLPSSRTWRRVLNTSGCAFSISSSSTTE